jgi:tetratricopeptide (TPR) repeat protein
METTLESARAAIRTSRPHAAIRLLEPVARDPQAAELLAAAYRRDARYEDCIALVEAWRGDTVQMLYEKAMSLAHLSEGAAAVATFDAVLAHDPGRAAAWFGSHGPALEVEGMEGALRRLERACRCHGANGKYHAFAYALRRLSGRHAEAAALFEAQLRDFPRRRALADGIEALVPALAPDLRLFGLSASLLRHALAEAGRAGMVLEFGVRRGTSIRHLAAAAGQEVHGFDSFEGLPEDWGSEAGGVLSTQAQLPPVPENVRLHAGWFSETVPAFLKEQVGPVRLVNIDSDLYSSAREVLFALAPRLGPGTVLVFDEFIGNRTWAEDEFKAFGEFIAAFPMSWQVFAISPATKQVAIRLGGRAI